MSKQSITQREIYEALVESHKTPHARAKIAQYQLLPRLTDLVNSVEVDYYSSGVHVTMVVPLRYHRFRENGLRKHLVPALNEAGISDVFSYNSHSNQLVHSEPDSHFIAYTSFH